MCIYVFMYIGVHTYVCMYISIRVDISISPHTYIVISYTYTHGQSRRFRCKPTWLMSVQAAHGGHQRQWRCLRPAARSSLAYQDLSRVDRIVMYVYVYTYTCRYLTHQHVHVDVHVCILYILQGKRSSSTGNKANDESYSENDHQFQQTYVYII